MAELKKAIDSLEAHLKSGHLSGPELTAIILGAFKDIETRVAALEQNSTPDGELRVGGKPVA